MAKAKLKRVKKETDFLMASSLAHQIWREHYAGIVSGDQIEYMLEKLQSIQAIKQAEAGGCEYYLIRVLGVSLGYLAVEPCNPQGKMFLSKFYILKEYRGKGYAREALNEVKEMAQSLRLKSIWLTVAKKNQSSIDVYKKLGFIQTEDICNDIGSGFVMDDYVMELSI